MQTGCSHALALYSAHVAYSTRYLHLWIVLYTTLGIRKYSSDMETTGLHDPSVD
jgi:hypothetical protein